MLPTRQLTIGTFVNQRNILMTFKGPATRSIYLLDCDFIGAIRWTSCVMSSMSIARVTSVTAIKEVEEICHSNEFVAAWIKKLKLESR